MLGATLGSRLVIPLGLGCLASVVRSVGNFRVAKSSSGPLKHSNTPELVQVSQLHLEVKVSSSQVFVPYIFNSELNSMDTTKL